MILVACPTMLSNPQALLDMFLSLIRNTDEDYCFLLMKNSGVGFAPAANVALQTCIKTGYDGVLLLNDDVIVPNKKWLKQILDASKKADIVGPRIGAGTGVHVAFWCVYISREVIEKIGFLDENFRIGEYEDVDFCVRAVDAGFKVLPVDVEVYHKNHGTLGKLNKKGKEIVKGNKKVFLEKYKGTKWEAIYK